MLRIDRDHTGRTPVGVTFFRRVDESIIGVMPARERAARKRLFDALEETLPVRFEGRHTGELDGVDGILLLPGADAAGVPTDMARLVCVADEDPSAAPSGLGAPSAPVDGASLACGERAPLDRRLRGQRLRDAGVRSAQPLSAAGHDVVLATRGADPLWLARPAPAGVHDHVAVAALELGEDEPLRERLRDGRFLALIALVHFARAVCAPLGWKPPPLRASFLFDDPNLHWGSYGQLRYGELVRAATRHEYHVAFATVPLDSWYTHPATARLFREHADRLSLVVHGNDHAHRELARSADAVQRRAMLAQALRRVAALERRSGVEVGRVMVAPHGVCSREVARELVPLGFEALCISRPYPWLARPPKSWLERPPGSSPLAGWEPASVVDDGLPVILRRAFSDPVEDLALRAFLDQPLVLYGHHGDMAGGIDRLAELASLVHDLGDVTWTSPAQIAATNAATRVVGDTLRVRMFGRRARLQVPDSVARILVELPSLEPHGESDRVICGDVVAALGESIVLAPGTGLVELTLRRSGATDASAVPRPGRRHWSVARRLIGETRDRFVPVYRRAIAGRR
jgi:hypothetical protein